MRTGALRMLGADHIGQRASDFMSATLKPRSVVSYYSSDINVSLDFRALEGVSPLDADTPFITRYISWAHERGRNKTGAFQPYLSAVNTFFRDHMFRDPVAPLRSIKQSTNGYSPRWTPAWRAFACPSR
eukprot:jgi/Tetstr1/464246/TSEL_009051.t1